MNNKNLTKYNEIKDFYISENLDTPCVLRTITQHKITDFCPVPENLDTPCVLRTITQHKIKDFYISENLDTPCVLRTITQHEITDFCPVPENLDTRKLVLGPTIFSWYSGDS